MNGVIKTVCLSFGDTIQCSDFKQGYVNSVLRAFHILH